MNDFNTKSNDTVLTETTNDTTLTEMNLMSQLTF